MVSQVLEAKTELWLSGMQNYVQKLLFNTCLAALASRCGISHNIPCNQVGTGFFEP